jgi:hypothetical protein
MFYLKIVITEMRFNKKIRPLPVITNDKYFL